MKKNLILVASIMLLALGCKKKSNTHRNTTNILASEDTASTRYQNVIKTPNFDFIVTTTNGENTIINIKTEGLINQYKERFPIGGQIKDSFMADLNNDGLYEFYIVISSADGSKNLQLLAFALNDNETISMVSIVKLKENRDSNTDTIRLRNNELYRNYKVDGIKKEYLYKLTSGEAGYILQPTEL